MEDPEGNNLYQYKETAPQKRRNRRHETRPSTSVLFEQMITDLRKTDWLLYCQQSICDAVSNDGDLSNFNVLCLGLGSPGESYNARAQLAFLISTCDKFHINRKLVSIYDPVFSDDDVKFLESLGLTCLAENKGARYKLTRPTLVFMPHCDRHLYENILRENWGPHGLENMILIANLLTGYMENLPSHKLASESPCLARIAPYLESRALPPLESYPTAFNNTAIQVVGRNLVITETFWEIPLHSGMDGARDESCDE